MLFDVHLCMMTFEMSMCFCSMHVCMNFKNSSCMNIIRAVGLATLSTSLAGHKVHGLRDYKLVVAGRPMDNMHFQSSS